MSPAEESAWRRDGSSIRCLSARWDEDSGTRENVTSDHPKSATYHRSKSGRNALKSDLYSVAGRNDIPTSAPPFFWSTWGVRDLASTYRARALYLVWMSVLAAAIQTLWSLLSGRPQDLTLHSRGRTWWEECHPRLKSIPELPRRVAKRRHRHGPTAARTGDRHRRGLSSGLRTPSCGLPSGTPRVTAEPELGSAAPDREALGVRAGRHSRRP